MLGIFRVQQDNGTVVIDSETKDQIYQLQIKLKHNLSEDYNIESPNEKKPKLKIVNINSEDVSIELDYESIIEEIKKMFI